MEYNMDGGEMASQKPESRKGRAIITLTTDFGPQDAYVGAMKGVILSIAPHATLVDITHAVPPQDIRHAGFVLASAAPYFPPDTIHVAVVDPGVGSHRRPIVVETERARYVAPDNGILTFVLHRDPAVRIVHLTNAAYWLPSVSTTFHGRDIFAPVAAHLACGVPLEVLGDPVDAIERLPLSQPVRQPDGSILGHIQYIDHFGNCVTDIPAEWLPPNASIQIEIAGIQVQGLAPAYTAVAPGELVALCGSVGYLEVAVREGNAAQRLGVSIGAPVVVRVA